MKGMKTHERKVRDEARTNQAAAAAGVCRMRERRCPVNEQNLTDCRDILRRLDLIMKTSDRDDIVTHASFATDAAERIEERLEIAIGASATADVPALNVVRCGGLVDGVTGEPR